MSKASHTDPHNKLPAEWRRFTKDAERGRLLPDHARPRRPRTASEAALIACVAIFLLVAITLAVLAG